LSRVSGMRNDALSCGGIHFSWVAAPEIVLLGCAPAIQTA